MQLINFPRGIPMTSKILLALIGVAALSGTGWSQTSFVYDDAHPGMMTMWIDNGILSEITSTDAYEGAKCLDFSYNLVGGADMAIFPRSWGTSKTFTHLRDYKYLQFAYKISENNTEKDELSLWCIHCDASFSKDLYYAAKVKLIPTSSWQVSTTPVSIWASDPIDYLSAFKFSFSGTSGSGHFYLDAIKFTNSTEIAEPPSPRVPAGRIVFPRGGKINVDLYTLDGSLISSRLVEVGANTAYHASQCAQKELRAGVYVVRQRVQSGETASLPVSEQLLLVKR